MKSESNRRKITEKWTGSNKESFLKTQLYFHLIWDKVKEQSCNEIDTST